jgi:S-disulfanyl-L-cysteine oxidoreductase SoxD
MSWIAAASLAAAIPFAVIWNTNRTWFGASPSIEHFANADDLQTVVLGKQVYMERCASCHGRNLQGQPLWQSVDQNSHRRAPAHDQTGHTWLHGDEELFFITKFGHFDVADRVPSTMPAFEATLDDHAILAVIAFIKARWPIGLRVVQAMRNPGLAGMPANAEQADWRFPPGCPPVIGRAADSRTPSG